MILARKNVLASVKACTFMAEYLPARQRLGAFLRRPLMQAATRAGQKPALFCASRVLAREDRQCDGAPEVIGAPSTMRAIIASRVRDTTCRISATAPQIASRVAVHRAAACRISAATPPSAHAALDSPCRPSGRKADAAVLTPPEPATARSP